MPAASLLLTHCCLPAAKVLGCFSAQPFPTQASRVSSGSSLALVYSSCPDGKAVQDFAVLTVVIMWTQPVLKDEKLIKGDAEQLDFNPQRAGGIVAKIQIRQEMKNPEERRRKKKEKCKLKPTKRVWEGSFFWVQHVCPLLADIPFLFLQGQQPEEMWNQVSAKPPLEVLEAFSACWDKIKNK